MFDYESLKPWLFKLQPESAHTLAAAVLRTAGFCPPLFNGWMAKHFVSHPSLSQELFGRTFLNPVGLAAGFDKNATMFHGIMALGFGFNEIGTLTPKPQEGNPRPRFLLRDAEVISVKLFGSDQSHSRLELRPSRVSPKTLELVAFRRALSAPENKKMSCSYTVNKNEWNGRVSLQLMVEKVF